MHWSKYYSTSLCANAGEWYYASCDEWFLMGCSVARTIRQTEPHTTHPDMRKPHQLSTSSLRSLRHGDTVCTVLAAALHAVDPYRAVQQAVQLDGGVLRVAGLSYLLTARQRVLVAATGKASLPMAAAVQERLGSQLAGGVVIYKAGSVAAPPDLAPLHSFAASHPLPDEAGTHATQQLVQMLHGAQAGDLVLLLLSGGSSALLTLPEAGITLAEMQATTAALLACGARIDEINVLRKHLDAVKGGKLARIAAPAELVTLVLSDVVGDALESIGSGPTVPDSSTFADALAILRRYDLVQRVPAAVVQRLAAGAAGHADYPDNPRAGDAVFQQTRTVLVGSNRHAATAAMQAAQAAGWHPLLLTTLLQGEAREVGRVLAAIGRELATSATPAVPRPACIIAGGETTVTLRGDGLGGRNQELALGAVRDLAGLPNIALITLATDGDDGPTDAAGAVVTGDTLARAAAAGLDLDAALARNDAYPFFAALDDLIKPGATGTNVCDLALLLAW